MFLILSIALLIATSYAWCITKLFYKEIRSKYILTINPDIDVFEDNNSVEGIGMKVFDEDVDVKKKEKAY